MNLSKHLTLKEFIKSNTATRLAIANTPTPEHLENARLLAENVFEPLRIWAGVPIGVSSGYRSKELNAAVKGSSSSDHCSGKAIDIDADIFGEITNSEIFHFIKDNLEFSQLIAEFPDFGEPSWCHVSYDKSNLKKQILIAVKRNNKTVYLPYKGTLEIGIT